MTSSGRSARALGALSLALCLGCVRHLEVPPPAGELSSPSASPVELPQSVVALPVRVSLGELDRLMDHALPSVIRSPHWESVEGGRLGYRYEIERGPIRIEVDGDRITAAAHLRYGAAVCVRPPRLLGGQDACWKIVSCGLDGREPRPEARVVVSSRLGISAGWSLEARTTIEVSPVVPCRVTFLRVAVRSFLSEPVLHAAAAAAAHIDAHAAELGEVRARAAQAWEALSRPFEVAPDLHLLVHPRDVALSRLHATRRSVELTVLVRARPQLVAGPPPPADPRSLPPLGTTTRVRPSFKVAGEVELPYDEASRALSKRLEGRRFNVKGRAIVIRKIEIVDVSGAAVLRAQLEAHLRFWRRVVATVHLTGKPVYDAEQQVLALEDVGYSLASGQVLVAGMDWLLSDEIRRWIQTAARFEVGDIIAKERDRLEAALNRELAHGLRLSGSVATLTPLDVYERGGRFVVRVVADGSISVSLGVEGAGRRPSGAAQAGAR